MHDSPRLGPDWSMGGVGANCGIGACPGARAGRHTRCGGEALGEGGGSSTAHRATGRAVFRKAPSNFSLRAPKMDKYTHLHVQGDPPSRVLGKLNCAQKGYPPPPLFWMWPILGQTSWHHIFADPPPHLGLPGRRPQCPRHLA